MKFYCDSCQTKYSIADEKVRGKVLKVRCKKCSHVITVREPRAPAAPAAARPGPPPPPSARPKWHYAINGQSFGPFDEADLQDLIAEGALGDGIYLWNETFSGWKPVTEVPAFREALDQQSVGQQPVKTLGISQPMQAIRAEDYDAGEEEDQTVQMSLSPAELDGLSKSGDAEKPKDLLSSLRQKKELDSSLERQSQRLQALRQRLQVDPEPAVAEASKGPDPVSEPAADPEEDLALAVTLPDGAEAEKAPVGGASVHDGLFSTPMSSSAGDGLSELSEEEDAVPFFPDAPKLKSEAPQASSMSRMDEITGSLLIQINAIKSDGRKRMVAGSIAGVVAMVVVVAVVYFGWIAGGDEVEVDEGPRIRADHIGQAPQFREYTEEERMRAVDQVVLEQALVISRADGQAALEQEEQEQRGGRPSSGQERTEGAPAMPRIDPDQFRRREEDLQGTRAGDDEERRVGGRFQQSGMVGSGGQAEERTGGGGIARADEEFEDERLQAMAALQTDTQRGVYNPRDEFDELVGTRDRLSNSDIAQGMQNVMASVASCRERHILRGGTLDHDRVDVTLQIETTGHVEAMAMSPSALENTDFGRCMASHIRRWRFPPFQEGPIEVQTPFLLQE